MPRGLKGNGGGNCPGRMTTGQEAEAFTGVCVCVLVCVWVYVCVCVCVCVSEYALMLQSLYPLNGL